MTENKSYENSLNGDDGINGDDRVHSLDNGSNAADGVSVGNCNGNGVMKWYWCSEIVILYGNGVSVAIW